MANTNEDRIANYEAVLRRGFDEYVSYGVVNALVGFLRYNNSLASGAGTTLPDGTIPQILSNAFAASAMTEQADRIVSTKSFQVPSGSVYLGPDIRLSAANRAINIQNMTSGRRALILAQLYTQASGSETPFYRTFGALETIDINLDDSEDSTGDFSFEQTTTDNRFIQTITVRSDVALPNCRFMIRLGDSTGPLIYNSASHTITGTGADETFQLENPIILDSGTMVTIQGSGVTGIKGATLSGVFTPYLRLGVHTFTETLIASQEYVNNAAGTSEPVSVTSDLTISNTNLSTYNFRIISAEATGSADQTITLPSITNLPADTVVNFIVVNNRANASNVVVTPDGTDTIGFNATITLMQGDAFTIRRPLAGTNWLGLSERLAVETFNERVQDLIGTNVVGGTGVTVTYDDTTGNTTIAATAAAQAAPVAVTDASLTLNSANLSTYNFETISIETTGSTAMPITLDELTNFPANTPAGYYIVNNRSAGATVTITRSGSDTIAGETTLTLEYGDAVFIRRPASGTNWLGIGLFLSDTNLQERVEDIIGSSVTAGTGVSVTYDDTAGTTTVANTGLPAGAQAPVSETTTIRIDEVNYTSFNGRVIECQAGGTLDQTITLGGIADLPANVPIDYIFVNNRAAASNVIISRSDSDTIGGETSITLALGQSVRITRPLTGSVWLMTADAFPASARTELIQDTIGSSVVAGTGISVTYNDTAGTTTVTNTGGGGGTTPQLPLQVSSDLAITSTNLATYNNRFISGTATGSALQTITLPELSTLTAGDAVQFTFTNKRASASTLRITRAGSDTVSSFTFIDLPNDNTITVIRPLTGTDWTIISEYDQVKAGYSIPVISAFSIDIASRVNLNTNLNAAQTINYNVLHTSNIQSLELFVSDGDNIALTVPTTDGDQSATPTLTGIDTSTAKTLTFRVQGVDTQIPGVAFQSNAQTVEVRNVLPQELLYYGVEADNVASTFDYANAENQEALSGDITIPTFTGNQYLKIAYPASAAAVTQLRIGGVDQLGAFTLSSDALTINTVLYDVLVSNNALDGAVVSGNIVTIIR